MILTTDVQMTKDHMKMNYGHQKFQCFVTFDMFSYYIIIM